MKFSLQQKKAAKNPKNSRHVLVGSIFSILHVHRLIKSRHAVSTVISNMILVAAVIAVGFSALAYANSVSTNHVTKYSQAVNEDIDQLRETVSFEYAYYNRFTRSLTVYFINVGGINNLYIKNMVVSNSTWRWTWNWTIDDLPMRYLDNSVTDRLSVGQQGYIDVALPQLGEDKLVVGNLYTIKLITGRGSIFAYNFVA